jgi:hypothetical protein
LLHEKVRFVSIKHYSSRNSAIIRIMGKGRFFRKG